MFTSAVRAFGEVMERGHKKLQKVYRILANNVWWYVKSIKNTIHGVLRFSQFMNRQVCSTQMPIVLTANGRWILARSNNVIDGEKIVSNPFTYSDCMLSLSTSHTWQARE